MKAILAAILACACLAQQPAKLHPTDEAVLDAPASRRDFRCKFDKEKPRLGFDLRYFAQFEAEMQISDFKAGDTVGMLVRVTPEQPGAGPLFLADYFRVPEKEKVKGTRLAVRSGFYLGEGSYKADLMLRDNRDRVCSEHWRVEVKHKGDFALAMKPFTARAFGGRGREPRAPQGQYHVKILANFSNTRRGRATLDSWDANAVGAILRTLSREPRFSRFSIAAFNMQEERVFYESNDQPGIDLRALYSELSKVKPGVVDYQKLLEKHSATNFVTRVLTAHLGPQQPEPDAVILVGPKLYLDKSVPNEAIAAIEGAGKPVFYLNYVFHPAYAPWRDSLARAVKSFGGREFRITQPKDLGEAMGEIVRVLGERPVAGVR